MPMMFKKELTFYGGYGEHGRSCFVIARENGRYLMVDCGILDTDPNPYPNVPSFILKKTDYIFVTHCHKDHIGAITHFIEKGFSGTIITEEITANLYPIVNVKDASQSLETEAVGNTMPRVQTLYCDGVGELEIEASLLLRFGRSGHCPGSLWFYIEVDGDSYLFSGDYQGDTLVNSVDVLENITVNQAVIDCGHDEVLISAKACRELLVEGIREAEEEGKTILMPMQQYGRGLELLWLIKQELPHIKCMADSKFIPLAEQSVAFERSYKKEALADLKKYITEIEEINKETKGVIFLSDTHFKKQQSIDLFNSLGDRGIVLVTGRVKEQGVIDQMIKDGKGVLLPYCHHQSEYDLREFMRRNNCERVFPFHGHKKRVFGK